MGDIPFPNHPFFTMDHPRTHLPQEGSRLAHGLPHFSWQWVSLQSPQFAAECLRFLWAAAGPRALTFGLGFSPPLAAAALELIFGPLRGRGPKGPSGTSSPGQLHQLSAVPELGPISASRPHSEGQSLQHATAVPPYHPIPGSLLSESCPLSNPDLTPQLDSAPNR